MTPHEIQNSPTPDIIENYRNFQPPAQFRRLLEELLGSVPAKYLKGLKSIVLCNSAALTRDQRRQKIWGRRRKYRLAEARGAYYRATNSRPATVWLFVDNILKPWPSWIFRIPIFCYADLGEVLFHEIGHHIHAAHIPVYDGKENVAEDWSRKLRGQFLRKRYWYLVPLSPVVRLALRVLAPRTTMKKDRSG